MGGLAGRVALVTGAASGIGRAITDRFVTEGARVVAGDIDAEGLEALRAAHGDAVVTVPCDVRHEAEVAALADRAGPIDVLVANAGKGAYGLIAEHPLETWQEIIDLCLTGVFLTIKHGSRVMRDGGSIITIASLNAIQPAAGMAAYCSAKAGVAMLSRVAAMELGHRGIRVNTIAPGLVQTNATAAFWALPEVVAQFEENAPLGRYAQPDEIANVAAFLASDESSFMSASLLSVDGGGNTGRYPDLPGIFARALGSGAS
jgi:NAD(P)-dependent dehydrogenase (short-subunit alcohol dehydrogenase family)